MCRHCIWQSKRLCDLGGGLNSLLEMFLEGLQYAHLQPFRTMRIPPEEVHSQVMRSWREACWVVAVPASSNRHQQKPWFIQTDACYDVGVTVLQQVLVQCSSLQWGNQFFSFHRSCLMRRCQYSIPQANRRRFSNKNSLHYFALSCFGVTGLRMQLLSALIATVFVTSLEMKLQRKSSARQWHLSALNTSHLGTQETEFKSLRRSLQI